MSSERSLAWSIVLVCLLVANVAIGYALFAPKPEVLTVSFLSVGQGDAILIEAPDGTQMLIDGGKDRSVLRELPKVMGPLDRSIDLIVETHPDADHIGGLPEVLARYAVAYFVSPGKESDSSIYAQLQVAEEKEPRMQELLAREGMRIHLGKGVSADVFHPENNVDKLRETNDASIVMRLVYGDTEFVLSGDAASWIEDRLVSEYGDRLQSDVLKAGHHGSKNSSSDLWLATVNPDTVVVSAGKGNSYGHPHSETLDRIRTQGAKVLSTIDSGTITLISDGKTIIQK